MRRISYNFTILPWHQQDYITHYTIHGHADTSEIDGDEAPECGAGYPAAQTLQTGGRPWTSGPGLGVSSGVTLCLIVCWGECVWSADVLQLVQITSLAASTFISVLIIKQK